MSVETLLTDDRAVARMTVAINAVIAQQVNDGRGMKPWIYEDTRRALGIAWYLDLAPLAQNQAAGDHYALVAETQAPANQKIETVGKLLADQLEALDEKPVRASRKQAIAA